MLDPEYGFTAQYARIRPQPARLPPDLAAEIEHIERRLGELEEVGEDDWTDELMTEAAQLEERHTEIDEMADGLALYAEKDRARAGCIVTIGDDGDFCLYQGLVERAAMHGASDAGSPGAEDDGDEPPTASDDDDETSGPSRAPTTATPRPPRARRLSPTSSASSSRSCARTAVSASCWSTISRRTKAAPRVMRPIRPTV